MKIIEKSLDSLIPYEFNNKIHDETQINRIANSIKEFWFTQPIVIDKNNVVIIGHWRLEGAKKLWMENVPVVIMEDLSEAQIKKLRILDNKLNESEWNVENLKMELEDLPDLNIWDLELEPEDLFMDILGEESSEELWETRDIDIPYIKKDAIIQRWDIIQLWNHRLMCWSSTDINDVWELMGDERAKILFTSPPYSDMREYNWWKDLSVENISKFISTYAPYTDYQCVNLWIQRKDNEVAEYRNDYIADARSCWYKLLSWNVWDKINVWSIWQQQAMFPIRHERIFVFWKDYLDLNLTVEKRDKSNIWKKTKGSRRNADWTMRIGERSYSNSEYKKLESIIQCTSEQWEIRKEHPATFPIELPWEYIKAMTKENEIVIESFWGSWSTLIACEQLNRKCRIMELDERYCEVIIRRFYKANPQAEIKCLNRDININDVLSD